MTELIVRNSNVRIRVTQPSTTETVYVLQGAAGPQGDPGVVQSVVPGDNVTVDNTDPANPVVSAATPVVDHGALTGRGDDDHPQYALADGSRGTFETAGAVATHAAAVDPHGDRAYADGKFAPLSTDTWHTVGGVGEPAFLNSWAWAGTGGVPKFYKDAANNVHIRGMVSGGASGTVVFQLPAGYRPSDWAETFTAEGNGGAGTMLVSVASDGSVYMTTVGGAPVRWSANAVFPTA